ncbi:MAG: hypothetical protein ACP5OO_04810 [Chloroflexia bacterium]
MSRRVRQTTASPPPETPPPAGRRYRRLSPRESTWASFTDERQYRHVRGELWRIAFLALMLFGSLVLLRLLSSALGLLP